jgi:hypothetical protein
MTRVNDCYAEQRSKDREFQSEHEGSAWIVVLQLWRSAPVALKSDGEFVKTDSDVMAELERHHSGPKLVPTLDECK